MANNNFDRKKLESLYNRYITFVNSVGLKSSFTFSNPKLVCSESEGKYVFWNKDYQKVSAKSLLNIYKSRRNGYVLKNLDSELPTLNFLKNFVRSSYKVGYIAISIDEKMILFLDGRDQEFLEHSATTKMFYPVLVTSVDSDSIVNVLLKNKLIPTSMKLSSEDKELLKAWTKFIDDDYCVILPQDDVQQKTEDKADNPQSEKSPEKSTSTPQLPQAVQQLLNCDYVRCNRDPYDARILSDSNRGHWDLWDDNKEQPTKDGFYARNPLSDVKSGVVAIDFGTKSTVVCFKTDNSMVLRKQISEGDGDRYENPTMMHFMSIDKFMEAYKSSDGRPNTCWNDLIISHEAMRHFKESSSREFSTYMTEIKQWAGNVKRSFRIESMAEKDQNGNFKSIILKPFMDLADNDFNPIEVYAYYIGLHINNMDNGIYLKYYLSFPVTYEDSVRKKMIESFERGLRKSMPVTVLNDEATMKNFFVNGTISEPLAYAVCALQQYGFEPDGNETFHYGIFDFGGGTTDFDFGIWKPGKGRFDFSIETFGGSGINTMGGENLLDDLAFEIFKDNRDQLKGKNIYFRLGPSRLYFAGYEDYLKENSVESDKNMHSLIEQLRPYWQESSKMLDNNSDNDKTEEIEIKTVLHRADGEPDLSVVIKTSKTRIRSFIKEKITSAVDNFFQALNNRTRMDKGQEPKLHIFLAGNSCKSPYVMEIFNQRIENLMKINGKPAEDKEKYFEIFPPLGSPESLAILKKRGVEVDDVDALPTGKTGVAFGLIDCRDGGPIEVITRLEEMSFLYYIGYGKRKKFKPFESDTDKPLSTVGKPERNVWYRFIDAGYEDFELYYTDHPECITGDMPITKAIVVGCKIDVVDPEAYVYIKAVNPHTLQYAVSKDGDVDKNKLGEIQTIEIK